MSRTYLSGPRPRAARWRQVGAVTAAAVVAALLPTAPAVAQQSSPPPSASASPSPASASPAPSASATVRLTTSATEVVAGTAVTLTGRVTDLAGLARAGEQFDVVSRTGGTRSGVVIGRVTSDADGLASLIWTPRTSSEYLLRRVARPAGDSDSAGAGAGAGTGDSDRRTVHVQPRLTGALAPTSVVTGSATTLVGVLAPVYLGARLLVQRRLPDGSWQPIASIGTNGAGAYRFRAASAAVGRHVYRVLLTPSQAHRQANSPLLALNVLADPTLREGDRGQAVRVLEQRLVAERVDLGAVDGVFDDDLRHGLTAFQKSQGLPRTGLYDLRTRQQLANPLQVRLRHPAAGRAVEVDLTKQVLYLSEGGVLQRIVNISSGNDRPYTVDGVTYRAFTPTGRFRVERKIGGVRVSRLGALYRPAYFVRGWAIHGSPSVPSYPASHGCIRTTNSSMDRLFALLTVGTPVTVFRS